MQKGRGVQGPGFLCRFNSRTTSKRSTSNRFMKPLCSASGAVSIAYRTLAILNTIDEPCYHPRDPCDILSNVYFKFFFLAVTLNAEL